MKFAVFSDLHYDAVPDADRRIDIFMEAVKREHAQFIIDLGDLCFPKRENKKILDKLNSCGVPCFHNIGNHNSDKDSSSDINNFFGVKESYFSFVWKDIKFINLDANYINKGSRFEPFYKRNYDESEDQFPYIPPFEIEWLVNELKSDYKYFVIFSHQSLANSRGNINPFQCNFGSICWNTISSWGKVRFG